MDGWRVFVCDMMNKKWAGQRVFGTSLSKVTV